MKLGTVSNRKILKQTALLLLCGVAGWYLKGKLTPSIPFGAGGNNETYVLIQGIEKADVSNKQSYIGHVEAIKSVNLIPLIAAFSKNIRHPMKDGDDFEVDGRKFRMTDAKDGDEDILLMKER